MKRTVFRLMLAASTLIILLLIFVAADYYGIFGSEKKTVTEFIEFNIQVSDKLTNQPVNGVKVRCFQLETKNACGQPTSRQPGVVRVQLVTHKDIRKTWLFEHVLAVHGASNPELKIMFIHPDYFKPVEIYQIPELMADPDKLRTVVLEPRITDEVMPDE